MYSLWAGCKTTVSGIHFSYITEFNTYIVFETILT